MTSCGRTTAHTRTTRNERLGLAHHRRVDQLVRQVIDPAQAAVLARTVQIRACVVKVRQQARMAHGVHVRPAVHV